MKDAFKRPDFPSAGMKSVSHMVLVFLFQSTIFCFKNAHALKCIHELVLCSLFAPNWNCYVRGVDTIQNRYRLHF